MVYLDYSATTPVSEKVLSAFNEASLKYIGNANSKHKLGLTANSIIEDSTNNILNILNAKDKSIIYTSGASESNNLAIKGIAEMYSNYGNHIITTELEHSSIIAPLNYLQRKGYKIDFVKLNEDGTINLTHLKELITNETILVTIHSVNSEVGILQPIEEISKIINNFPHAFLHVDMTQSIGKVNINLNNIDLVSFSAHKIYGIKGIGGLLMNKNIKLTPLIHGGKSTSIFRSGTPALPLILSLSTALKEIIPSLEENYNRVKKLNTYLVNAISSIDNVRINSNNKSIPHILNVSIVNKNQDYILDYLSNKDIYVSTLSACSSEKKLNGAVFKIYNDELLALSSIRISLSFKTTFEELDGLIKSIKELANESN